MAEGVKLFFSAGPTRKIELDPRLPSGIRYRLMSCHGNYVRQAHVISQSLVATGQPFELQYDSGAFSAWSQGEEVNLNELIEVYDSMIEKYAHKAEAVWLINLDKIPGSRGVDPTPAELDEACKISDRNFEILRKHFGDRILPIFHQGESDDRLHEIAAQASYICVSPRNDLHESVRRSWAQETHTKIPGVRTHGLAATGLDMMRLVPWHSVDSATWIFLAANGAVFRDERLRALHVSTESSYRKDEDQHLRTLSKPEQEVFLAMVERRGFKIEELEHQVYHRMVFNRIMMTEAFLALDPPEKIAATIPTDITLGFPLGS